MALKCKSWADEISDITDSPEFQTCEVLIQDESSVSKTYDAVTNTTVVSGSPTKLYEGRARFIPVRAGVFQGGESQANTTHIRSARIQIPSTERGLFINKGCSVTFTKAPFNPTLERRVAIVADDFQGTTTAARTIHVYLDADVVIS